MRFEWDPEKSAKTKALRGVSFEEAEAVFVDPYALSLYDSVHSEFEERYFRVGRINSGDIVVVIYTDRPGDVRRLISVRKAAQKELKIYYEQ